MKDINYMYSYLRMFLAASFLLFGAASCYLANASDSIPNIDKIMMIESSGNPYAHNKSSGARGLFQITPVCLEDYNQSHQRKYTLDDLFNPTVNRAIASWYLHTRIPKMLSYYKIEYSVINSIVAYNWGVGNCVKWVKNGSVIAKLPEETREYLRKYGAL